MNCVVFLGCGFWNFHELCRDDLKALLFEPRYYLTDHVSVNSVGTHSVIDTVSVGLGPSGVAVGSGGLRVYVTNNSSHTLSVIATATNTVVETVSVGSKPRGVAASPDAG